MAALKQMKQALRRELKLRLSSMSVAERTKQSEAITQRLIEHPVYKRSQRVSIYLSMTEEVHTMGILRNLFETNKMCFIPQYIGDKMDMLRLHSMEDYDSLPKTKWNIKQPAEGDQREEALSTGGLDLIIVPGLGFSKDGDRLGRGKGYYDNYQKRCTQETGVKPYTIALAYNEQICDEIPTSEYDVKIDEVLWPDRETST
ncbi:5-formyltetrahydrofolate cyclo-ligase-like [Ptychodera flava]|uniref:5-formyltetrahydrofolate cyclo-ligase-like n=1 Tax=Ptychodera flava TaxID=63121 RepID=UPI00396A3D78